MMNSNQYTLLKKGAFATLGATMLVSTLVSPSQMVNEVLNKQVGEFNAPIVLASETEKPLNIKKIAGYDTGVSAEITDAEDIVKGAAEIISYNKDNQKFYLVNGVNKTIDVVSLSNVATTESLVKESTIDVKADAEVDGFVFGDITSLGVNTEEDVIAIAVQHAAFNEAGKVLVYDYEGALLDSYEVGYQPDALLFNQSGSLIFVANEGEPREGISNEEASVVDPEGSVSVIDTKTKQVTTIKFDNKWGLEKDVIIRNEKEGASVDFEPEYIALNQDETKAYVALQENNAIATIDVATLTVESVKSLGFQDHSVAGLDAARDNTINIETLPILGVKMPDGITTVNIEGQEYILTANEGDASEWGEDLPTEYVNVADFEDHVENIVLGDVFKGMTQEEANEKLEEMLATHDEKGRSIYRKLELLTNMGDDALYTLGGRSFSIYNADTMELVFDSGDDFEQIIANTYPEYFNFDNDAAGEDNVMDRRSTKKGPEPEDVKVGVIDGRIYAFIGIERQGGFMTYDITDPANAQFVEYYCTRDFEDALHKMDSGPEGLTFIDAENSPTNTPLLLVANEVSGTVAINEITPQATQTEEAANPFMNALNELGAILKNKFFN